MSLPSPLVSLGEFAFRVSARPGRGDWLVLLVNPGTTDTVASEMAEELASLREGPIQRVEHSGDAQVLARTSQKWSNAVLVISGLEGFSEDEWRHMDVLRSQFQREECLVLVLDDPTAERLMRSAPNLTSWIGGSVWKLATAADSLSSEEREERLKHLRAWAQRTDEEVVELAQRRQLPTDPEYAEWLVLLNRGDLLER